MPGANCAMFGCSTSRKHKDVSLFQIPRAVDEETKKWRADMLNIITRDRVVDEHFKQKIEKNKVWICQKHFTEDDMYHCK